MKASLIFVAAGLAVPALCAAPLVSSNALQELITLEELLAGSQKLQDIADANGGNRAFGGAGHNATVDYLYTTLMALDYFDVTKHAFVELFSGGFTTLSAAGVKYNPGLMTYTPSGKINAPLVNISNLGCAISDFPARVTGNIALISRGECPFTQKAANAKTAGAAAAVVYNNQAGQLSGTLGGVGNYVPIVGINQTEGNTLLAALSAGQVIADLVVESIIENRTTYNIIAETKTGDHNNVLALGGHTDSVAAGPGINDDGSGTIGILNVAVALSKFSIKNAVRFCFWSAEEFGKLGSFAYMKKLNQSAGEVAKIRAYLNFDMIASPNYVLGIYDGDGSAFSFSGPLGSATIEKDFEDFYKSKGVNSVPSLFSGRSDYAAFLENGIPSGGLFTGAEIIKTAEEAALFGGEAGVAYDVNYHQAGDNFANLNHEAYLLNTQSIANSVAKYALSFEGIPAVNKTTRKRGAEYHHYVKKFTQSHSHAGPCGEQSDTM
ncbi:Zn-dependent exopeptidase [Lindgomyces ingoldianus]|uniref:Zn-dependent exopeptidase n=1 Tax=Lindgomyces ingoldianus TaxID=673940 RepID=A0ACB6R521_9PLEO|nr:Zn-dependent exopeptidase [Lindgomyces ingoldianus]KAF2473622.1 Zn-dependent exopeptidase [Lindgomyces ingoldianus]